MAGIVEWLRVKVEERDAAAARRLANARGEVWRGRRLVRVRRVYREARDGTMAWVEFDQTGDVMDAWFWHTRVRRGDIALAEGSVSRGTIYRRDVFYVNKIVYVLPRNTYRLAQRYEQRLRKRQISGQ